LFPPFRLQPYTSTERHKALELVREAVLSSGASILDFQQFSNESACLTLEIQYDKLTGLYSNLVALPVSLSPTLELLQSLFPSSPSISPSLVLQGSLAVFFAHNEPDLRLTIPAVPG